LLDIVNSQKILLTSYDGELILFTSSRLVQKPDARLNQLVDQFSKLTVSSNNQNPFSRNDIHFQFGKYMVQLRYIQEVANIESNDQFLQGALSFSLFRSDNTILAARSVFFEDKCTIMQKPCNFLKVYNGIFESFRMTPLGLVLNVDLSYLLSMRDDISIYDWCEARAIGMGYKDFYSASSDDRFRREISSEVKGYVAVPNYNNSKLRRTRLAGIDFTTTARKAKFQDKDGKTYSVEEYFKSTYKITLQFPNIPLLQFKLKPPKSDNNTKEQKEEKMGWLPIELFNFERGQNAKTENDMREEIRSQMIDITRLEPLKRMNDVKEAAKKLKDNKFFREFRVDISDKAIQVEATVLPVQKLVYFNNQVDVPYERGVWNLKNKRVLSTPKELKWVVFCYFGADVDGFINSFLEITDQLGMGLSGNPVVVEVKNDNFLAELTNLQQHCAKQGLNGKPDFIFFIFPDKQKGRHDDVKRKCDIGFGIPSKCMVNDKKSKLTNGSVLANIAASINAHLIDGQNWAIEAQSRAAIVDFGNGTVNSSNIAIFGMDVCHGSQESTAALVMSRNDSFNQYYTVTKKQKKARREIVDDIKAMMVDCLKAKLAETKKLPSYILFYRDGVGEGMYDQVLSYEASEITKAFTEVYTNTNQLPKLTIIVVQKRHHLRAQKLDDGTNPYPGTLIDSAVIDKDTKNFYLYSHKALAGTARPTHYQVLIDEINIFSRLPKITYALAHLHQGCTKSVSLPAPVFYADKAAGRAHEYYAGGTAQERIKKGLFMI